MTENPMIESMNVKFSYKTPAQDSPGEPAFELTAALDGVSLKIKKGEFAAVLGHNGSGKSTFAKIINALLLPTEGSMRVGGLDVSDAENIWSVRQMAGMVFQNPDNQIIATIIEEDVAFGPENLGVPADEIRARVDWALSTVGMAEYASHSPHFLSGGQKQRVAIAGVLAMKPACIVLDEPTAMLDPAGRREVIAAAMRLNREEGMTVVLITHYMDEAAQADRVIVMEEGRVVMDAPPRGVFSQAEVLRRLGLDVPPATEIAIKLARAGIDIPADILTIEELSVQISKILKPVPPNTVKKAEGNPSEGLGLEGREFGYNLAIELKNLCHIYNSGSVFEKKALTDISMTVKKGEFIGLIGHTGSGKSTLIQHLNALLTPSSGSVIIDGAEITADKAKLKEARRKVGLVFQYPEHQLFEMTVFKDVAFGPENMGLGAAEIKERVEWALEAVGIPAECYEKSPFDLSGGQKRRVAIAGVLAMKPEILILDEPAAGLDPRGRDEILSRISDMRERLGLTVLLVSHSMEDVARCVDRIIVMNKGRISFDGTPAEVFMRSAELEEMGLSAPQAARFAEVLRNKGFAMPCGIYTVDGAAQALVELYRKQAPDGSDMKRTGK